MTAADRAKAEADRAQRAETATATVRDQLDATHRQLDQLREQAAELHRTEAAATAEREAARADVDREQAAANCSGVTAGAAAGGRPAVTTAEPRHL